MRPPARLSAEALNWVRAYSWPGNIRELRNLMERTALLCRAPEIRLHDLMDEPPSGPAHIRSELAPVTPLLLTEFPRDTGRSASHRARITAALERCGGNQTRAARLLGISRTTLSRRIATLDLPRPRKRTTD